MNEQTPMPSPMPTPTSRWTDSRWPETLLWASAFVLGALILLRAGGWGESPEPSPRPADMVSSSGDYQVMTTASDNEELVYVLDGRSEQLMVYSIDQSRNLAWRTGASLPRLFNDARAGARGNP